MQNLKKVETLFHTTTSLENLEKIIDSNFQISYSKEIFKGRETQIPMASFSNVLLFETKSQINYGDYSIGMTKKWGITNKLHPVSYTYDDSDYENSIQHLSHIGEVGKLLDVFHVYRHFSKITLKDNPDYEPIFENLLVDLDEKGRKAVIDFFETAHPTFVSYELFTKKITAQNKKGQTFECFNDREWRYLPEDLIDTLKGYIERMGTGTADIVRLAKENNLQEPVFEQNEDFKTTIYRPSTDQVPTKYRRSSVVLP